MLGSFGFTVAAIAFLIYGTTSYGLAGAKPSFNRANFFVAYILISLACIVWAIGIQLDVELLKLSIYTGDALLLGACAFLLSTTVKKSLQLVVLSAGAVATVLLVVLRVSTASSDAFVRDGILVFNTPRVFGAILAVILLTVWVRANMNFFSKVIDKSMQPLLRPTYFAANLIAYVGVIGFLSARKNITITVSFVMIVVAFFCLVALNSYARKPKSIEVESHARG